MNMATSFSGSSLKLAAIALVGSIFLAYPLFGRESQSVALIGFAFIFVWGFALMMADASMKPFSWLWCGIALISTVSILLISHLLLDDVSKYFSVAIVAAISVFVVVWRVATKK